MTQQHSCECASKLLGHPVRLGDYVEKVMYFLTYVYIHGIHTFNVFGGEKQFVLLIQVIEHIDHDPAAYSTH
jgi:hypothetical protein